MFCLPNGQDVVVKSSQRTGRVEEDGWCGDKTLENGRESLDMENK